MAEIELAELIGDLRSELSRARAAGEGKELRFEVGPVELDVTLVVTKEGVGSGKVRFWVVEMGGEARVESSATQRLKLVLTPQLAVGGKTLITGEAVEDEH